MLTFSVMEKHLPLHLDTNTFEFLVTTIALQNHFIVNLSHKIHPTNSLIALYNVATFPQIYAPLPAINRMHTDCHKEGEIPTIHLVGNQTKLDLMHKYSTSDLSTIVNMSYIGLNSMLSHKEVEISLAGRSSRWVPKLSYNIDLSGNDRLFNNQCIKLRVVGTDPSYIREQLAYDIINAAGLASAGYLYVRCYS
jgi:hypothetical protein